MFFWGGAVSGLRYPRVSYLLSEQILTKIPNSGPSLIRAEILLTHISAARPVTCLAHPAFNFLCDGASALPSLNYFSGSDVSRRHFKRTGTRAPKREKTTENSADCKRDAPLGRNGKSRARSHVRTPPARPPCGNRLS